MSVKENGKQIAFNCEIWHYVVINCWEDEKYPEEEKFEEEWDTRVLAVGPRGQIFRDKIWKVGKKDMMWVYNDEGYGQEEGYSLSDDNVIEWLRKRKSQINS
jgi:hypothetical protein